MNPKKKAVLDRIKRLEEAITKGREYLESGKHAQWRGFRPLFDAKVRDGKILPPHKDWVKNVFSSTSRKGIEICTESARKAKLGRSGLVRFYCRCEGP